jgi:hypothetical protein
MTTENFKNIKEWGIFATGCLVISYFILNILCHNFWTKGALSNWIFIGPLLILPYAGFFISMHLISRGKLTDESDKTEIREICTGLKASVAGFVTWLIALFILDIIQVEINIILSLFCGCALFLGIYWLLKRVERRSK